MRACVCVCVRQVRPQGGTRSIGRLEEIEREQKREREENTGRKERKKRGRERGGQIRVSRWKVAVCP